MKERVKVTAFFSSFEAMHNAMQCNDNNHLKTQSSLPNFSLNKVV